MEQVNAVTMARVLILFTIFPLFYTLDLPTKPEQVRSSLSLEAQRMKVNESLCTGSKESYVHNTSCTSPWLYRNGESCQCGKTPHSLIKCRKGKNPLVLGSICVTYDEAGDATEIGLCPYLNITLHGDAVMVYYPLPKSKCDINNSCKKMNRIGTLCGQCEEGYNPLVYSFDMYCIRCPNGGSNWWKFALVAFLPSTIFYFIILFFKVNVTSSSFYSFVFFCQAIANRRVLRNLFTAAQSAPRVQKAMRYTALFYGIWNLDFFRSLEMNICLGTDTLQTLALDLTVSIYPLLLVVLTYLFINLHNRNFKPLVLLCKPFRAALEVVGRNWEVRTSLIDSFATFFFLSHTRTLSVVFDLLLPVKVYRLNSTENYTIELQLYYDATIPYFGHRHKPYAILGILVLLAVTIVPALLLIVYPSHLFQRLLNLLPVRLHALHTFMDAFQGCYKDGTEPGTRDCRWFASVYFITQFIAMIIGGYTEGVMFYHYTCMLIVVVTLLILLVEPFKRKVSHYTHTTAMFVLFLALWYASITGISVASFKDPRLVVFFLVLAFVFGILPLFYTSVIILLWIYRHVRFGQALLQKFRAWRNSYSILD